MGWLTYGIIELKSYGISSLTLLLSECNTGNTGIIQALEDLVSEI